jgi:hypothetical protein
LCPSTGVRDSFEGRRARAGRIWFTPNGDWAFRANIVSCDFIDQTQLSQSLITASVIKATKRAPINA